MNRRYGLISCVPIVMGLRSAPSFASPPTPKATIIWHDATGDVSRRWSGSLAEQSRIIATIAGPAAAVDPSIKRYPCHADDFQVENNTGLLCFVDAGDVAVQIYSIGYTKSGNNAGYYSMLENGTVTKHISFVKNQVDVYPTEANPYPEMTYLQIN